MIGAAGATASRRPARVNRGGNRRRPGGLVLPLLCCVLYAAGCEREERSFRGDPPGETPFPAVRNSGIQPGVMMADASLRTDEVRTMSSSSPGLYQENRWAVAQGQIYYTEFNCAGCHAPGGGGGMGPPLSDGEWIYGSEPDNVFATIVEGRPNGMPSFGGRITTNQLWQLVAYVRALGGLTPLDTWPGRGDHMNDALRERERGRPGVPE